MFEDSLFASNRRRTAQQRWSATVSFLLQATLVAVIVSLPLFFTDALPLNLRTITALPSVPRSAGPPATEQAHPMASARGSRSELVNNQLVFRRIPRGVPAQLTDVTPPVPPCFGTCVVGSPGPGGRGDDNLGSILGPGFAVVVPRPPGNGKPVVVSRIDEGLLIRKVTPVYPRPALFVRQQGTVLLHAIIGRDGTIQQLQAVSGPPLLIGAAMDAVSQWRYRPYILNGEPVEVETQITVNFRLGD